jgi:hypothetical protein
MAVNKRFPRTGSPLSRESLRRMMGYGQMYDFMDFFTGDKVHHYDDFLGDTINLDMYAVANSGGAGAASFATQVLPSGAIRSASGTTDNGACNLIMPLNWYGDLNCGMEVRWKIDDPLGFSFDIGFIDAVPGSTGSAVSDIDTPAFTAADCAVLHLDTDQTLATLAFGTKGSTANQDAKKTNMIASAGTTIGAGVALGLPVAATWNTTRVQLSGNDAYCWINGILVASHTTTGSGANSAGAVEGGIALAPWIYNRTRNTTTKLFDVDYIRVWMDRV